MDLIADYQIIEEIHQSRGSYVYRALDSDRNAVILKVLPAEQSTSQSQERFKKEYQLIRSFQSGFHITAHDFFNHSNTLVMVLEDIGGVSLKELIPQYSKSDQNGSTDLLMQITMSIAQALSVIHDQGIIHNDINPSNIIYKPENGDLRIIDFGIATERAIEHFNNGRLGILQGTYPYISPEQTGRMNCGTDFRTDFYSLGITLYELFTGQLPFHAQSEREWIHCHIAKPPADPATINENLPDPVSAIIMKLMQKSPALRYQSSYGIIKDIEVCRKILYNNQIHADFKVGAYDISQIYQAPKKLYGREREVEQLRKQFHKTIKGYPSMIFITGYSGIGKTSLVNEIQRIASQQQIRVFEGKFEQVKRNIPYYGFIQAFNSIVNEIISNSSSKELAAWKEKFLNMLGNNAQLIINLIPGLEMITGMQPAPTKDVSIDESYNRFALIFKRFLQSFPQPDNPLILFLDDMQWADNASLKMLENVFNDENTYSLMFIGAFRDDELPATHPLYFTLDRLRNAYIPCHELKLEPLSLSDIKQWVLDRFQFSEDQTLHLSKILLQKTLGNAFFVNEFIKHLCQNNCIRFSNHNGQWEYDAKAVEQVDIHEDIITLISKRLENLSKEARLILLIASCIGYEFSLDMLVEIRKHAHEQIHESIQEATGESLIVPLAADPNISGISSSESHRYKFLHDRIKQAAYELLEEEEKEIVHLKIGRLYINEKMTESREVELFTLTGHLNRARDLLKKNEKQQLAEWNLEATKKALQSGAHEPAKRYALHGIDILDENAWNTQFELAYELYTTCAEIASIGGDNFTKERLLNIVSGHISDNYHKARTNKINIQSYIRQHQYQQAILLTIETLKLLGVKLTLKQGKMAFVREIFKSSVYLRFRNPFNIKHLSPITDKNKLLAMDIMAQIIPVLYRTDQKFFAQAIFKLNLLTLQHGVSPVSPIGFIAYGIIQHVLFNSLQKGIKYGNLGIQLLDHMDHGKQKNQATFLYNIGISPWKEPLIRSTEGLLTCYESSLESGDFETMINAASMRSGYMFSSGVELKTLFENTNQYKWHLLPYQQEKAFSQLNVLLQAYINLREPTDHPYELNGDYYNEHEMIHYLKEHKDDGSLFIMYLNKMIIAFLFEEIDQAAQIIKEISPFIDSCKGFYMYADYILFETLVIMATSLHTSENIKDKRIRKNLRHLHKWSTIAPMNFRSKYILIKAEIERSTGNLLNANNLYKESMMLANQEKRIHEEAIANELAGKMWLENNHPEFASIYLNMSFRLYEIWGATAKASSMLNKHKKYISPKSTQSFNYLTYRTSTIKSVSAGTQEGSVDLQTVLEASKNISSEIVLSSLLHKTLSIILEHAGAHSGKILLKGDDGQLKIEAEGTVKKDKTIINIRQIAPSSSYLPISVINYVERTQQMILLHNAIDEGNFKADEYIRQHKVKSVIALPLLHHNNFTGMLYLENNFSSHVFTYERINILTILCTQAVISIENARVYNSLEQKVKERTKEITEKNMALLEQKEEIETTHEQLKELNATKDKLFSVIAHDLKSPLSGIHQFLDTLSDEKHDITQEEANEYLKKLRSSTKRAYQLLENLLTWARSQRGEIEYHPEHHNLYDEVNECIELFSYQIDKKQITVENQIPKTCTALYDKDMMKIVLRNLINNAVKFVYQQGQIILSAQEFDDYCEIRVSDNGIGLNTALKSKLFRIHTDYTSRKGTLGEKGTGLGLILCKEIINQHGGSISCESKENEGSTFIFTLPRDTNLE